MATFSEAGIHHHARGELLASTLASRTIRLGRTPYERFHHIVLLIDGVATLGADMRLKGPALAYLSAAAAGEFVIEAGSQAVVIGGSPEITADAIGNKAESYALRIFMENPSSTLALDAPQLAEVRPLVMGFVRELTDPARESWMVASAYLRLMLTTMLRGATAEPAAQRGLGEVAALLQRYRQLVEVHLREHRRIADYAADLGITADRLHAICRRTLGRSPVQLLHERLAQEASLRLERSNETVKQIAHVLGFHDPAHFSHFFRKATGHRPAYYRRLSRSTSEREQVKLSSSYADWP